MAELVLEINDATFSRLGKAVFENISWQIKDGEHWVILGATASGKTSLLKALAGNLLLTKGTLSYPFLPLSVNRWEWNKYIQLVAFTNTIVAGSGHYYQQRYNLSEDDHTPTVQDFLKTADAEAPYFKILKIEELKNNEILTLSNGQTRRVLLAKALSLNTQFLLFDNPFAGLDVDTRIMLRQYITQLISEGHRIVLTCTHREDIPDGFTHALTLQQQRITFAGSIRDIPTEKQSVFTQPAVPVPPRSSPFSDFEYAVKLKAITIRYSGKTILNNIDWCVRKNEKWALLGPNGSGKSTLLSLINADNPQAYANDIQLFDQPKRDQSMWAIKKRVGFFSPELQAYFQEDLTVVDVLATGYSNTFIPQKNISPQQYEQLDLLLCFYNIGFLRNRQYLTLSSGEQRLVLFLRALLRNVDLLILDEPFQGFDEVLTTRSKMLLNQLCADKTLLFVTHYPSEIPSCVTHVLQLKDGCILLN